MSRVAHYRGDTPHRGLAWIACALSLGCKAERRLTAGDCAALRERIEGAWIRDALAAQGSSSQRDTPFIGEERRRIGEGWQTRCAMWLGLRVDERELACLHKADTIDDVNECAR